MTCAGQISISGSKWRPFIIGLHTAPAEHCEHSLLQTSNQPPARLHSVSRRNNVDTNINSIRYLFLSVSQSFSFNLKRSPHPRKPISRHQLNEINQENLSRLRDLDLIIFICPCQAEAAGGRYQEDLPPILSRNIQILELWQY